MKTPATIQIGADALHVDGIRIAWEMIPQFLYELAHPDPRKWYRFEARGESCIVHVKVEAIGEDVMECACGYSTQNVTHNFCPYDGKLLHKQTKRLEVRDGRLVEVDTRSGEPVGGQGQETIDPRNAPPPYC